MDGWTDKWKYRELNTQSNRQKERWTDSRMDRKTNVQTDKWIGK